MPKTHSAVNLITYLYMYPKINLLFYNFLDGKNRVEKYL